MNVPDNFGPGVRMILEMRGIPCRNTRDKAQKRSISNKEAAVNASYTDFIFI
jgi:hypothetical protein